MLYNKSAGPNSTKQSRNTVINKYVLELMLTNKKKLWGYICFFNTLKITEIERNNVLRTNGSSRSRRLTRILLTIIKSFATFFCHRYLYFPYSIPFISINYVFKLSTTNVEKFHYYIIEFIHMKPHCLIFIQLFNYSNISYNFLFIIHFRSFFYKIFSTTFLGPICKP